MEEKKYLKWYNKIGYGSGDIAGKLPLLYIRTSTQLPFHLLCHILTARFLQWYLPDL